MDLGASRSGSNREESTYIQTKMFSDVTGGPYGD